MLYYIFSMQYAHYMTEKMYADILKGWGVLVGEARNCQPFVTKQSGQRGGHALHTMLG